jgi:uncharacterized protein
LDPTTPARFGFGQGIYAEDFSQKTYAEMRRRAGELLAGGAAQGHPGRLFKSAAERARVRELAGEKGARAVFIQCVCPREVVQERLRRRADDASAISDGRPELLDLQIEGF